MIGFPEIQNWSNDRDHTHLRKNYRPKANSLLHMGTNVQNLKYLALTIHRFLGVAKNLKMAT